MVEYMKVQDAMRRLPEADAKTKYVQIPLNNSFSTANTKLSEADKGTKPVQICSYDDPGLSLVAGVKRKWVTSSQEL